MDAYDRGFLDGLSSFAYWEDDEQYVAEGVTLKVALEKFRELWSYRLREQDYQLEEYNN